MTGRLIRSILPLMLASPAAAAIDAGEAGVAWARVLAEFVRADGAVRFSALAENRRDLDIYLAYVAHISPRSHPNQFRTREAKLAYHINSYNALAMHNVLEFGVPDSLGNLIRRFRFFYLRKHPIGGRRISLYHYENDVIRPLGDPRVHFALNCMVVSCPRLPRQPFVAEDLDARLDRQAREFFAEQHNLRIDSDDGRIRVSEILKFYREDFLHKSPSLVAYINGFVPESLPESFSVEFIDYDWTVNAAGEE